MGNETQKVPTSRQLNTSALNEIFGQQAASPVVFIETLINEAVRLAASDVLFEPARQNFRIRMRIDGVLYEAGKLQVQSISQISARMKVLAKLDPTQKREIQEGQYTQEIEGRIVNLRVEISQKVLQQMGLLNWPRYLPFQTRPLQ